MGAVTRISFEIAFEGSSRCGELGQVEAIELIGAKSAVSAKPLREEDSYLQEGFLQWHLIKSGLFTKEIALSPKIANTIKLTAKISHLIAVGAQSGKWLKQSVVPIVIEDHPELKKGESYLIKVRNIGGNIFKAELLKKRALDGPVPSQSSGLFNLTSISKVELDHRIQQLQESSQSPPFRLPDITEKFRESMRACFLELNSLSISELEGRITEKSSQKREAEELFCQGKGTNEALERLDTIKRDLVELQIVLRRKQILRTDSP